MKQIAEFLSIQTASVSLVRCVDCAHAERSAAVSEIRICTRQSKCKHAESFRVCTDFEARS